MSRQRGFSLLELAMVLVVFAIAAVPLVTPLVQTSQDTWLMEDLRIGAALAQECAETVLGVKRDLATTYADVIADASLCDNILAALPAGFARPALTFTDVSASACGGAVTCHQVAITITKDGNTVATTTVMIADY